VFSAITEKGIEKKVNEFLAADGIKVLQIEYAASSGGLSVMIVYEETAGTL